MGQAAETASTLIVSMRTGNPEIFLFDVTTGNARNLTNHPGADVLPAWSPDGKKIAFTSSRDGANNIYVMDADGSHVTQVTHEEAFPGQNCYCATWSPDGKKIAFCRVNGKAEICVINLDGTEQKTIARDAFDPSWSPDGERIAFVSNRTGGFRLNTMDPDGGNVKEVSKKNNPAGNTFPAWSPTGQSIAYADFVDGAVELFVIDREGKHRRQLTYLGNMNIYPVWSPDGQQLVFVHSEPAGSVYLAVNGDGTMLRVSPLASHERPQIGSRPSVKMQRYKKPAASDLLAVAHEETIADDQAQVSILHRLRGHTGPVTLATFSPDGKTLATASEDASVVLWNMATPQPVPRAALRGHGKGVFSASWSPDGKTLATGSQDQTVRLWNPAKQTTRDTLDDFEAAVHGVAYSPDGKWLATIALDRTVLVRDTEFSKVEHELELPGGKPRMGVAVAFAPDSKTLVASGGHWDDPKHAGTLACWDLETGKELWSATDELPGIWGLAFAPDGKTLAGACLDGTIRLWDPDSGKEMSVLKGHTERVIGIAFTPDGKTLASSSYDHTVRLWDVETGHEKARLAAHLNAVQRLGFTPDGKRLATASADGSIAIWKIGE
jgi:WD40 repeat protein